MRTPQLGDISHIARPTRHAWRAPALALAATLLVFAPAPDAAGGGRLRISSGPTVLTEDPTAGKPVDFRASAVFPGEEWIGFQWDFGDGVTGGGITYQSSVTSEVSHVFTTPGTHRVLCTAYHGFKSGVFGEGPFKYRMSRTVSVKVAPSLPLTIGVLTVDGENIAARDGSGKRYRVSGNVRINGGLTLSNDIDVDFEKVTVTIAGALGVPGAGSYADGLAFAQNITLDAATGGFASVDLPRVSASFDVHGLAAKLENVRIVGAGIEFDFEVRIPRISQDPAAPTEPPAPGAPLDLSHVYPKAPSPKQLAALSFKQFRVDAVAPYLHPLGETKATISNVPLGFAGTKWGIESLEAGIDPSQERFFGSFLLKLPTDRGVGATFEIREGQLEKVGATLQGKLPFWTFTGALDAIYVNTLSGNVVNLAQLEGQPPRTPMVVCGAFDPGTGNVSEDGIVIEWGPSTNLVGQNVLTPLRLRGACTFDPFWNVAAAGQLSVFEDVFGERMRLVDAQGSFHPAPDGTEGGTWMLRGDLVFDPLFALSADLTTTYAPGEFRATAYGNGTTLLPSDHWIAAVVPQLEASVEWTWRSGPFPRNRLYARGHVDVPGTYPVLAQVLNGRGVGWSYDFETGETSWQVTDVVTDVSPGKAVARTGTVAGGAGAQGLVVTLRHASGSGAFDLRLPDGTVLTPASADGQDVDFVDGPAVAFYALRSAPDGTYTAQFDDAALGSYDVSFFIPAALPELDVTTPATATTLARYDTADVAFSVSGVAADAPVRVLLDDDGVPGGGFVVATGGAADGSLAIDLAQVPAGTYDVVVEALGEDGAPVRGTAPGHVVVEEHVAVAVTRGSLVDGPKAGKDKVSVAGTLRFAGSAPAQLFDPQTETLHVVLGGDAAPLAIDVPAGDLGWKANAKGVLKWRSPKGATPVVALLLDPVKRRFSVKATKAEFTTPAVNPVRFELVFGSDRASDTAEWTEKAPGRLVR